MLSPFLVSFCFFCTNICICQNFIVILRRKIGKKQNTDTHSYEKIAAFINTIVAHNRFGTAML
jgi:hypothetical protein